MPASFIPSHSVVLKKLNIAKKKNPNIGLEGNMFEKMGQDGL